MSSSAQACQKSTGSAFATAFVTAFASTSLQEPSQRSALLQALLSLSQSQYALRIKCDASSLALCKKLLADVNKSLLLTSSPLDGKDPSIPANSVSLALRSFEPIVLADKNDRMWYWVNTRYLWAMWPIACLIAERLSATVARSCHWVELPRKRVPILSPMQHTKIITQATHATLIHHRSWPARGCSFVIDFLRRNLGGGVPNSNFRLAADVDREGFWKKWFCGDPAQLLLYDQE
jgi:hypothetical protein